MREGPRSPRSEKAVTPHYMHRVAYCSHIGQLSQRLSHFEASHTEKRLPSYILEALTFQRVPALSYLQLKRLIEREAGLCAAMIILTHYGEYCVSVSVGKTGCCHGLLGPPSSRNCKSSSGHPQVSLLHAMRHLPCRVGVAEDTNQGGRAQQRKDPELYMNNMMKAQAAVRPTADNTSCSCFLIFPMFNCR